MRLYQVLYQSGRNKHGQMTSDPAKPEGVSQPCRVFHTFVLKGWELAVACRTVPQSGLLIILGKYIKVSDNSIPASTSKQQVTPHVSQLCCRHSDGYKMSQQPPNWQFSAWSKLLMHQPASVQTSRIQDVGKKSIHRQFRLKDAGRLRWRPHHTAHTPLTDTHSEFQRSREIGCNMFTGRSKQSPQISPRVLLRYLRFIRGCCGDSFLSGALFPVCLFSSLFVRHDLITGTVSRSQVTLINSGMNAEFSFLLITSSITVAPESAAVITVFCVQPI